VGTRAAYLDAAIKKGCAERRIVALVVGHGDETVDGA
jgi:hypothetical protein